MLLIAAFMFASQAVSTAAPASPDEAAALRGFESFCQRSEAIWNKSLCGPVVLVDPDSRRAVANVQPPDQGFTRTGDVWIGMLPAEIPLANTSVEWGGQRWAEVLLPLPEDTDARRVLLSHEAFHRIQPELGTVADEADNSHLDTKDGRIFARLEMEALTSALKAARAGHDWRSAARDALAYRSARAAAFANAAASEGSLLTSEGLAEYTGIVVGAPATKTQLSLERLRSGVERPSLIRSFGYVVGPAYGLLLDRTGKSWRSAALEGKPLPDLLTERLGLPRQLQPDMAAYGAPAIIAEEVARDTQIQERRRALTAELIDGPTVTFHAEKMKIAFNPNSLFPLGEAGTVYNRATTVTDEWGELKVSGNVLISPKWDFARVPGPPVANGPSLSGPGWSANLAPGYSVKRDEKTGKWVVTKE